MKSPPAKRRSGPKRKPSERKSTSLHIPVTTRQRDTMQRFAAAMELDFAPWARSVLMREVGKEKAM